ncbi:MAG TPA: ribbon-helix-helix domain-containing protein [Dissulfurispiraceae bacterium]
MEKTAKKSRKPKRKLKVKAVLVRFTKADFQRLEQIADELQTSISSVVRQYAIKEVSAGKDKKIT